MKKQPKFALESKTCYVNQNYIVYGWLLVGKHIHTQTISHTHTIKFTHNDLGVVLKRWYKSKWIKMKHVKLMARLTKLHQKLEMEYKQ